MGVLAHRLEQPVPGPPAPLLHHRDERPVDQPRQQAGRKPRDGAGRVGVEAAHEHRQSAEGPLLVGLQQPHAPRHGRAHAAVVLGEAGSTAGQVAQTGIHAGEDLRRRHRAQPGRGQLDRQRQAVEPRAQPLDRGVALHVGHEPRHALPRALQEQVAGILGAERVQPPHGLADHAERLPAGGHDADPGAVAEHACRERRARVDHVLAVVEHQHQVAAAQGAAQRSVRPRHPGGADAEHPRRLGSDVGCAGGRREIHDPHAIRPAGRLAAGQLQRQAGLPHAARAGQRDEAGPAERLADRLQLARAPDERRQRDGEVVLLDPVPLSGPLRRRHRRRSSQRRPGTPRLSRRSAGRAPPARASRAPGDR